MRRASWSIVVVVAIARAAAAQPAGAEAEVLFRQGRDLMAAGKFAEACAAFAESERLDPAVTTLLNLASCREKVGQLATAWGLFLDAERQTRMGTDPASEQLHDIAHDHASKLELRVSKLTIEVPDDSKLDHLEIARDKDAVTSVMWNRALPLDGGTYTITARAPGVAPWTRRVTVANEGDAQKVTIPNLRALAHDADNPDARPRPATPAPAPAPVAPEPKTPVAPPEDVLETESGDRTWHPYALAGGGVVLTGLAVVLAMSSSSTNDDAEKATDNATATDLWNQANHELYAAEAVGVVGIACIGAGVWMYMHEKHAADRSTGLVVHPALARDHAGVAISGAF